MENQEKKTTDQVKETPYEICVLCGKETDVPKTEHIDTRYHYIEGAGQLCDKCGTKMDM